MPRLVSHRHVPERLASDLIKHRYGDISSASMTSYLNNALTASKIKSDPSGTKNALLYKYVTTW